MASILTNSSAMTALSVLRKTNDELSVTQSRISTGMKVGSAKDNASFWAVSQVMKSDVGAYKAIGDNLSLAQASTSVARDGAEKIADLISKIKGKVTSAQEGSLDKAKIQADVDSMLSQIGEISKSANFNGVNLLESSDTVKLLSSLGRSDSGVAASYISFDAVNLTMDDGGLAALDGLSVMSRGDQVLNNETDGVTSFTIAQSATALAQGDKLKFTYVDADGVERTLTHTVSQAIAADATGGQKLVDELNANASFSKQFKITYDGANTQFKLSAADRDSDIQVTNWSGNSFATASNRQWVNTYGAVANANGNAAQAMTIAFTDTAGKSVTLSFTADTDDAVDDNVAASIQTALRAALDAKGYDSTRVGVAINGGNVLEITSNIGAFGALTETGGAAIATDAGTGNTYTGPAQSQQFEFKDAALKAGEEVVLNYSVNNVAKQITLRVATDTDSGVRLDDQSDADKITLALDSRKVSATGVTGDIIADEVKEALASLAGANAYGVNNTSASFSSISQGAAAATANTDISYTVSSGVLTLKTATNSANDSIQKSTVPTTDYQSLLDSIESAYTNALDAAASLGSAQSRVDIQKDFVKSMIDNLNTGIGTLVDADMNEESARLQALQVQQQLGIQALSIANQQPQMVLSLFR